MASANTYFMDLVLVTAANINGNGVVKAAEHGVASTNISFMDLVLVTAANINGNGVVKEQQNMVWLPRIFPSWI